MSNILDFMGGEVVEDERVALAQLRTKHLLEIDCEHFGIDGALHQKGGFNAFMPQGRNKGGTLPVAVRDRTQTTFAERGAPIVAGQLGVQPRFINKDQATDVPVGLLPSPKPPGGLNISAVLLGGARRFFYTSGPVAPAGATKR